MSKSTDSQLLRVLLKQNEEGRGPSPEPARRVSSEEQQKVDPLPPRDADLTRSGLMLCLDSKMILQMEFDNVQLSCLSSVSMGGVLVCLENGMLHEYFSEEEQMREMTLQVNQVCL